MVSFDNGSVHILGNALRRRYLTLPLLLQIGVAFPIVIWTGLPLVFNDLMVWLGVNGDPVARDSLW